MTPWGLLTPCKVKGCSHATRPGKHSWAALVKDGSHLLPSTFQALSLTVPLMKPPQVPHNCFVGAPTATWLYHHPGWSQPVVGLERPTCFLL